jgi:hypothetical protein
MALTDRIEIDPDVMLGVARPSVGLPAVVIAVVAAGAAAASAARRIGAWVLNPGIVIAVVDIKHRGLHMDQFPGGRTRSLE